MGKKKIVTKTETTPTDSTDVAKTGTGKKKQHQAVLKGQAHITSSYNNTIVSISDADGNVIAWTSAGSLGFKGARKSTPYAATMVAKEVGEKARRVSMVDLAIAVSGIGPGREAAIRALIGAGFNVNSIVDNTPVAHNGVRPPKPRRV